jgi:hypothetical protein
MSSGGPLDSTAVRIDREDVPVMLQRTDDEIDAIRELWPRFEQLVGLAGRRMYALVNVAAREYVSCTPIREDDDPVSLGLEVGVLPGGPYLRSRIKGEPPGLYERIAPGMQALVALTPIDPARPYVEYYRRYDEVELWVPIAAGADPAPKAGARSAGAAAIRRDDTTASPDTFVLSGG